jgi:hypothetical protein
MDVLDLDFCLAQLVSSPIFKLLYAIGVAKVVLLNSPKSPIIHQMFFTIVASFGGAIINSVLLSKPTMIFFGQNFMLSALAIILLKLPIIISIANSPLAVLFLKIVEGISLGCTMPNFLVMFRSMELNGLFHFILDILGKSSFCGQFILGFISIRFTIIV